MESITSASWIITFIVVGIIVLLFFIGLRSGRSREWAGMLTSVGIFGTFLGIALALFYFDPSRIAESVPALLGGMRVAFVTSVTGIFFALLLRGRALRQGNSLSPEGKTADDIYQVLTSIEKLGSENSGLLDKQIERLGWLNSALLAMKNELVDEFKQFAVTMAERNTDALIDALKEVIRDFNAKLSEQFGENFKQLNSAVGRLVEWQEQYRTQLEQNLELMMTVTKAIEDIEQSVGVIAEQASIMTVAAQKMDEVLTASARNQRELEERLAAFAHLRKQAVDAFPVIEANMKRLTDEFAGSVNRHVETANRMLQVQEEASRQQRQSMERSLRELDDALKEELTKSLESLGSQLASLSNKFVQDYGPLTEQLRAVVRMAEGLDGR